MSREKVELVVDVLVWNKDADRFLFIKRAKEPFMDKFVMPGGHVEASDASSLHAAARELSEEVGLNASLECFKLLAVLDSPDRDPRSRKVSVVYCLAARDEELGACRPGSDAAAVVQVSRLGLKEADMGFDHYKAVSEFEKSGWLE